MADTGSPYISLAVFCENILKELDGSIGLIRIFDRYNVPAPSPQFPSLKAASAAIYSQNAGDETSGFPA